MTPMYEAEFIWSEPAGSVILTGEFDNWSQSIRLSKGEAGFSGKVQIPYAKKTDYKFVVDGRWAVNPDFPTEWDGSGNMNNYIMAPSEPPPSVLALNAAAKAANISATSATSTVPEPVTPINRPENISSAVTPLAVPESAIAPHPTLTFDSAMARSIVESFLEVVNPANPKSPEATLPTKTEKVNEPASTVKALADATAPSAVSSALQGTLSPYVAKVQDKATEHINAINGSISPLLHPPHTSEAAPVSAAEKKAEPGYPIRDLASLTGAAPVVVAAQDKAAHGVSTLKESMAPLLKSASNATATAAGGYAPASDEEKLAQPGHPIRDLASGPAQVFSSAQGAISPAMASINGAVSPVIVSTQEKIAPAVAYAQEKAGPVLTALQSAMNSAVATITESPAATPKDTLALPSKPVAEVPVAAAKGDIVPDNKISVEANHSENPIVDAAKPLAVPTGTIPAGPIDLTTSPVEPAPAQAPNCPSTPPPTDKLAIPPPSTPPAATSVSSPTSPTTSTYEKNGVRPNGPSSTFNGTTTSTAITPVKPTTTKRRSSLGAKFFSQRGSGGNPGAGSGSDTEGASPLRGSVKRGDSATTTGTNGRSKRRSIIGRIKDAFHHPDHILGHNRSASTGSTSK
ncbi:hypothetical protein FRB96_001685 [Tulasnella sp. 330]|nr:hypothetical protein FRB96_001685 [Tulasnella sp. 330]